MTCGSSGSSILRLRCSFPEKTEEFFADSKYRCIFAIPIGKPNAEIAQLVERNLAKVEVAGPSPVFRSKMTTTGKVVVFFVSGRGPGCCRCFCRCFAGAFAVPFAPSGLLRQVSRRHFAVACRLLAVPVRLQGRSGGRNSKNRGLELLFLGKMAINRGENCHLGFQESQIAKTGGLNCHFRKK